MRSPTPHRRPGFTPLDMIFVSTVGAFIVGAARKLRRKQRDQRGFTAFEVLASVVFLGMVFGAISQTAGMIRHQADLTSMANRENSLRFQMEGIMSSVREARNIGVCLDFPEADPRRLSTSAAACNRIEERPFALVPSRPGGFCFYARDPSDAPLDPPHVHCLQIADSQARVLEFEPNAGTTHTNPAHNTHQAWLSSGACGAGCNIRPIAEVDTRPDPDAPGKTEAVSRCSTGTGTKPGR
jgi:type II secretory pathway pseudopilin PulG